MTQLLCCVAQEEHEAIVRGRKEGCDAAGLTWAEYKSMTFTSQVSLTRG